MKLTKRQNEYIDQGLSKGSYVAFPRSIFKSKEYKDWLKHKHHENRSTNPS